MLLEIAVIYLHHMEPTVRNPDLPLQAGWEDNELIHREMCVYCLIREGHAFW